MIRTSAIETGLLPVNVWYGMNERTHKNSPKKVMTGNATWIGPLGFLENKLDRMSLHLHVFPVSGSHTAWTLLLYFTTSTKADWG